MPPPLTKKKSLHRGHFLGLINVFRVQIKLQFLHSQLSTSVVEITMACKYFNTKDSDNEGGGAISLVNLSSENCDQTFQMRVKFRVLKYGCKVFHHRPKLGVSQFFFTQW